MYERNFFFFTNNLVKRRRNNDTSNTRRTRIFTKVYKQKSSPFSRFGILCLAFAKDEDCVRIKLTDRGDFGILNKTDIKENLYARHNA